MWQRSLKYMRVKPCGVQMKIKTEFLYDNIKDITYVYVWRGMQLISKDTVSGVIDDYERDGILEMVATKYKRK